jgi:hypothetical protein
LTNRQNRLLRAGARKRSVLKGRIQRGAASLTAIAAGHSQAAIGEIEEAMHFGIVTP